MNSEKLTGNLQLVSFTLGEEEYAVDILKVREIIRVPNITRVPRAPEFVEGVINLRGKVIPVIDLRKRFGLSAGDYTKGTRIIVLELERTIGMVVDGVSQVLRLGAESVEPPPPIVSGISSEYLKGVGKVDDRLIILLDVDKILDAGESSRLLDLEEAGG